MPRDSARASRSNLSSADNRTSIGLPAPFFPGAALVGAGILPGSKRSLSAADASLRARISRITRRLSQAASDRNSRSATTFAWSFIPGETLVFRVSVQRIGAHLALKVSRWLSCILRFFQRNSYHTANNERAH